MTAEGSVLLTDFMPLRGANSDVIRRVTGLQGRVSMRTELTIRTDYGRTVPWVTRIEGGGLRAVAGPHMLVLQTDAVLRGEDLSTVGEFSVTAGEVVDFTLTYGPSHLPVPPTIDPNEPLADTEAFWREWAGRCDAEWTGGTWQCLAAFSFGPCPGATGQSRDMKAAPSTRRGKRPARR